MLVVPCWDSMRCKTFQNLGQDFWYGAYIWEAARFSILLSFDRRHSTSSTIITWKATAIDPAKGFGRQATHEAIVKPWVKSDLISQWVALPSEIRCLIHSLSYQHHQKPRFALTLGCTTSPFMATWPNLPMLMFGSALQQLVITYRGSPLGPKSNIRVYRVQRFH